MQWTDANSESAVNHSYSFLTNEDCTGINQTQKKNKTEMQRMSELLQTLIELETKSAIIESAIRQQGREIKLDIFPDEYDKRTAPPRINGNNKSNQRTHTHYQQYQLYVYEPKHILYATFYCYQELYRMKSW